MRDDRLYFSSYRKFSSKRLLLVWCVVCNFQKNGLNTVFLSIFRDEARHGKAFEGLLNRYFK